MIINDDYLAVSYFKAICRILAKIEDDGESPDYCQEVLQKRAKKNKIIITSMTRKPFGFYMRSGMSRYRVKSLKKRYVLTKLLSVKEK